MGLLSTANGQPPSRGPTTCPAAGSRRHLLSATTHTGCNGQPSFDFDFGGRIGDPLGVVTLSTAIQDNTCPWHPACVSAVIRCMSIATTSHPPMSEGQQYLTQSAIRLSVFIPLKAANRT